MEAVVPPLQKEYCMYSKRVAASFTCTPDLSRANPSPGSLVAILTFLTQPMAASSKSSSKSSGRTKTQVSEAERESGQTETRGQKDAVGVVSQTAHTYTYTPWRLRIDKASPTTSSSSNPLIIRKGAACKISFAILQTQRSGASKHLSCMRVVSEQPVSCLIRAGRWSP